MTEKNNFNKFRNLLIALLIITILLTVGFLYSIIEEFKILGSSPVNWTKTGQVGDFFGGVIGTLVASMGFILIYMSFQSQNETQKDQRKEFLKSEIENRFLELIKLHKENLASIIYENKNDNKHGLLKDRKAVQFVVEQIEACFREIDIFFKDSESEIQDIYHSGYLSKLRKIKSVRANIDLRQLAHIDIAYSIVFYGTSTKDLPALESLLNNHYKNEFISPLLKYIRLKSVDKEPKMHWENIQGKFSIEEIIKAFDHFNEKGRAISNAEISIGRYAALNSLLKLGSFNKFYGGHQYKLGHYFRHLFQVVKYINTQTSLSYREKYDYIKIMRAQLSTIEQYLIFYNSLSFMGRAWEINHIQISNNDINFNKQLFTKYNFIKNVANLEPISPINIKAYYPDINYEFEEKLKERKAINSRYIKTENIEILR